MVGLISSLVDDPSPILNEIVASLLGKGVSSFTESIYDTAWVSQVIKPSPDGLRRLYPECIQIVLDEQLQDGSWTGRNSEADGILNSIAALLALCRYRSKQCLNDIVFNDAGDRISRAILWLDERLRLWDVSKSDQVGFEILIPAHMRLLEEYNIKLYMPPLLQVLHDQKLNKFKVEMLYGNTQLTALHCLEAFEGLIDFNAVAHHKRDGSILCSPSATAAYLMHCSSWDDEAESYLERVFQATKRRGFPSAFPTFNFEAAWTVSALLEAGFSKHDLGQLFLETYIQNSESQLESMGGVVGFAPGVLPDADDSAKVLQTLALLDRPKDMKPFLSQFYSKNCFKTYPMERNPSFSANCNALKAMINQPNPNDFLEPIHRTIVFLSKIWHQQGVLKDKWNTTEEYSIMLLTQTFARVLELHDKGIIKSLPEDCDVSGISSIVIHATSIILRSQEFDGSWKHSEEMTSYSLLTLCSVVSSPLLGTVASHVQKAIIKAREFLVSESAEKESLSYIWIEKVTYASRILSRTYRCAAIKASDPRQFKNLDERPDSGALKLAQMCKLLNCTELMQDVPQWLLMCWMAEGQLLKPKLRNACSDIFASTNPKFNKFLDFVPLTWIGSDALEPSFKSSVKSSVLWDMMVLSKLNFEVDYFMEVVGATESLDLDDVEAEINKLQAKGNIQLANGSSLPNASSDSKLTNGVHKDGIGGLDAEDNLPRKHRLRLRDVSQTLAKYLDFIVGHSAVQKASPAVISQLRDSVVSFLQAHLTQMRDNRLREAEATTGQNGFEKSSNPIPKPTQRSYYDWLHKISAIHTSCPVSWLFYCCLVNPSPGKPFFQGSYASYLSHDLVRHLAALCRMQNDLGSIARDQEEKNLNSVDFSEFERHNGQEDLVPRFFNGTHCNGDTSSSSARGAGNPEGTDMPKAESESTVTAETPAQVLQRKRAQLRRLADYEEVSLEVVLSNLAEEIDDERIRAVNLFVRVTKLYGQIYIARDIGMRRT